MQIDVLEGLKWSCYTKEGNVEIYNKIDRYNISNNDRDGDQEESGNNKVDRTLIDIIEDLYYVLAIEKLEESENLEQRKICMSQLKERERKYSALLHLKELYYTEVQSSIERINEYSKYEVVDCEKGLIKFIYKLNIMSGFLEYNDVFVRDFLSLKYWDGMDLEDFRNLMDALIDIRIYGDDRGLRVYDERSIVNWFRFFASLRSKKLGLEGEILWLLFFLDLFRECLSEEDFKWSGFKLEERWKERLSDKINETTDLVEEVIGTKIVETQNEMLMCYTVRPMSSNSFNMKIECLVDALQTLSKMEDYKGKLERYFKKRGSGCIAVMHSNSKRYVAISGSEFVNKYSADLEQILGAGYSVVELNEDVRYYHAKNAYITYGQYMKWKNAINFDESKVSGIARMFSCCERKLLTELYGKGSIHYTIYVKKEVCSMCENAIEDFDEEQNCKGLIKHPKNISVRLPREGNKDLNRRLNKIAKNVRDSFL